MPLAAIFYARFHPARGPTVIHQYPENAIVAARCSPRSECREIGFGSNRAHKEDTTSSPLVTWSEISSYIIPPYEFCDRALSISVPPASNSGHPYRLLGYPVSIVNAGEYARNRFTFNVCFVLSQDQECLVHVDREAERWAPIVQKTAAFFIELEEDDGLLQADEKCDHVPWAGGEGYPPASPEQQGVIYPILEAIFRSLVTYTEACVRVDDLHVLNLRLEHFSTPRSEPTRPPGSRSERPKVNAWDVPVLIRPLPSAHEWTWDLTLERIAPFIDGVNHVRRIAELADVDPMRARRAVGELLRHERVVLIDIFHFQAIYALRSTEFAAFVQDPALMEECRAYVAVEHASSGKNPPRPSDQPAALPPAVHHTTSNGSESGSGNRNGSGASGNRDIKPPLPSARTLIAIYRTLAPGRTVQDLCLAHEPQLPRIDVRRLISFGVLKGFLRRIHKYVLAVDVPAPTASTASSSSSSNSSNNGKATATAAPPPIGSAGSQPPHAPPPPPSSHSPAPRSARPSPAADELERAWKKAALSSGWATPPGAAAATAPPNAHDAGPGAESRKDAEAEAEAVAVARPKGGDDLCDDSSSSSSSDTDEQLRRFLDGTHCVDEMCVELHMSETKVLERLRGRGGMDDSKVNLQPKANTKGRAWGEVVVFCR